jgi:DNA polymerase-1
MTPGGDYPPAPSRTVADLPAHFAGEITLAVELVSAAGLVKAALLDFDDGPNHWPWVRGVRRELEGLGFPPLPVSASGSKGYGLWLFFAEPLPVAQVQQFLRATRAAFFPELAAAAHDLRPDVSGSSDAERISGKAVVKFPPCLHRKSGRWSTFIDHNQLDDAAPPPVGLEHAPELAQQDALLSQVQPIPAATFLRVLDVLQRRARPARSAEGPAYFPKLDKLPSGQHPPCIAALLEKGAPQALDYNTANLNLAAYAAKRGLEGEQAEELARRMAEASAEHPTSKKSTEAKLSNFRSNRHPRDFACDYARNTSPWSDLFGGREACRGCPANPGLPSDKPSSRTVLRLEPLVSRELLAWAWKRQEPLPSLNRIWPSVSVATPGGARELALYRIAAQAAPQALSAEFFRKVDSLISESRDQGPLRAAAEAFLSEILALEVTDAAGRAALKRAQELEGRAVLAEEAHAVLAQGPEVPPNVVALKLRQATEGVLRAEHGTGPLRGLRAELARELSRDTSASVPSPFPRLNGLLHGGFMPGRLYVLLAPPKAGKTTFAAQCLDYAASQAIPCLYVGYEMARSQMVTYALARRCSLDSRRIEMHNLGPADAARLGQEFGRYLEHEGRCLEIWEAGLTTTLADVAAWALKAKTQHPGKVPLVVIDYLQLARTGLREIDSHPSETKRVSEVAVACKDLARQTGAAVLALSSVTKQAETDSREKGELDVNAARDSLAIVHAADGVLAIQTRSTRPEEKGDAIDPWAFLAQQAREQGAEADALALERALQPDRDLGKKYPQHGTPAYGLGTRARLSLLRHRGSTGDVPLYYRRAWHSMEAVDLPGLPSQEEPGNADIGISVFRGFAEAEPHQAQMVGLPETGPKMEYRYITRREEAVAAIAELEGIVGLDLETTGLSPLSAQARLLSLAAAQGPALVIDLPAVGGLHALRESLEGLRTVAHNALFDAGFLWRAGVRIVPECTLLAFHVLNGRRAKLSELAKLYLEIELDKTHQKADWSGELSEAQLRYAALDAVVAQALLPKLLADLEERESLRAYELARDAQASVVQMRLAGVPFDSARQRELLVSLGAQKLALEAQLAEGLVGRNPRSGAQLAEWLTEQLGGAESAKFKAWPKTAKGQLSTGADELKRGLVYLPEAAERLVREALLPFKEVDKKLAAFGDNLANHIEPGTGRIHADFSLAGTVTGRMSCSQPNLQQIPRAAEFRSLFAPGEGRAFVIADYSQMELRVAAILAGEETLLEAYRQGQDTHRITAGMILGKPASEITKQERQLAKAVNFGLLYGQGAKGLQAYAASSYGVEITEAQARQYRTQWFQAFPAFEAWHRAASTRAEKALAVRTPGGRERRWASREEFKQTEAFNTPVQGGAAEVILAALARLPEKLAGLDAVPVAVVHDEIIIEAALADAPAVALAVEAAMVAGMLEIFPEAATLGLVEAHVGTSWADK